MKRWICLMAAREAWSHRFRLLFLALCIALGVAAFTATAGFSSKVRRVVKEESRSLLGADLSLRTARQFSDELRARVSGYPGIAQSTLVHDTVSMGQGPNAATRLLEVRAVEDNYPLLGNLTVEPELNASALAPTLAVKDGALPTVFVEKSLAEAWNLTPLTPQQASALSTQEIVDRRHGFGLSGTHVVVLGIVVSDSGRAASAFSLGPRIYLDVSRARELGLLSDRSRLSASLLLTLSDGGQATGVQESLEKVVKEEPQRHIRVVSAAQASGSLARPVRNLNIFLDQVGLATLLLAIAGGWLSLATYLRSRTPDVAILRCLGTPVSAPSWIFGGVVGLVLAVALGLGVLGGRGVGLYLSHSMLPFLPESLRSVVANSPFEIPGVWDLVPTALILMLVCLPAVVNLQSVSPLAIIRGGESPSQSQGGKRFRFSWGGVSYALAVLLTVFLMMRRSPTWQMGIAIAGAVGSLFVLLAGLNALLVRLLHTSQDRLALPMKIAASQLTAKGSLAGLIMGVLGMSLFLTLLTEFTKDDLVGPIAQSGAIDGRPNVFFIDVQPDQVDKIGTELSANGKLLASPLVRARLVEIAGTPVASPAVGRESGLPLTETENTMAESAERMRTREQNLTYRGTLESGEEIVEGKFWADEQTPRNEVSLEVRFAERIGARVGDELTFDVQGVPIQVKVTSLRRVSWQNMRPNFFIVVHPSVLKEAPQVHILAQEIKTPERRAEVQREITSKFPNVTVIDVAEVAARIWRVLDTVSNVTKVLAAMMLGSALMVLGASLLASRAQRVRDMAILRAMGAGHGVLRRSLFCEFLVLGICAGLSATAIAWASAFAVSSWVLELPASPSLGKAALVVALYTSFVILVGGAASVRLFFAKPADLLRSQ